MSTTVGMVDDATVTLASEHISCMVGCGSLGVRVVCKMPTANILVALLPYRKVQVSRALRVTPLACQCENKSPAAKTCPLLFSDHLPPLRYVGLAQCENKVRRRYNNSADRLAH